MLFGGAVADLTDVGKASGDERQMARLQVGGARGRDRGYGSDVHEASGLAGWCDYAMRTGRYPSITTPDLLV